MNNYCVPPGLIPSYKRATVFDLGLIDDDIRSKLNQSFLVDWLANVFIKRSRNYEDSYMSFIFDSVKYRVVHYHELVRQNQFRSPLEYFSYINSVIINEIAIEMPPYDTPFNALGAALGPNVRTQSLGWNENKWPLRVDLLGNPYFKDHFPNRFGP